MSPYILFITTLAVFWAPCLGHLPRLLHYTRIPLLILPLSSRKHWRKEHAQTSAFVPTLAARRTEENSTKPPPFTLLPNRSLSSSCFVLPDQKSTPGGGPQPMWAFTSANKSHLCSTALWVGTGVTHHLQPGAVLMAGREISGRFLSYKTWGKKTLWGCWQGAGMGRLSPAPPSPQPRERQSANR